MQAYPDFQKLQAFRFHLEMIKQAYKSIGITAQKQDPSTEEDLERLTAAPAVLSAGLEAFSNLLQYLKTDYTIQGKEISLENSLLTFSVVGSLSKKGDMEVHLPLLNTPSELDSSIQAFVSELKRI